MRDVYARQMLAELKAIVLAHTAYCQEDREVNRRHVDDLDAANRKRFDALEKINRQTLYAVVGLLISALAWVLTHFVLLDHVLAKAGL